MRGAVAELVVVDVVTEVLEHRQVQCADIKGGSALDAWIHQHIGGDGTVAGVAIIVGEAGALFVGFDIEGEKTRAAVGNIYSVGIGTGEIELGLVCAPVHKGVVGGVI